MGRIAISGLMLIALSAALVVAACTKEVEVEVPVIVEKEVVREVEVPVQVIVEKEVIKEVEVPGETIIVEKEVVTVVEVEKIVTVIATAIPTKKFSKEDFPVPGSILTIAHETVGPAVYHRPNAHAPWYTAMMHFGIGDALVDYDGIEDSGMIAESWDIDQDKVVWHIQRGIPWHDAEYGTVSASDVQWSYEEANREGTLIPYGQYFTRDFENPQILDSHTLQWDWKDGPVIGYTWLIRHWNQGNPIMSQDYYDDVGEDFFVSHPLGTGPYKVISLVSSDQVDVLVAPGGAGELAIFCGALVGAGLGFLWFNAPPAMVFMGDTGSLALGGALGVVAVITKHEVLILRHDPLIHFSTGLGIEVGRMRF